MMIQHYFKVALRNLLKYKTHSLISSLCLAIGIVCFSMIGYFLESIDGSTRELPNYERRIDFKMSIENNPDRNQTWIFHLNEIKTLEERKVAGIEIISYNSFKKDTEMLFIDKEQQEYPFEVKTRCINNAFFYFYHAKPLFGNRLPQAPDEVVITESCARKVYGQENPIGTLVTYATNDDKQEKQSFKIVNVIADIPMELNVDADLFMPCQENSYDDLQVQGLLAPEADIKQVNRALEQIKTTRGNSTLHYVATRLADQYDSLSRLTFMAFISFLSSLILLSGIINFLKFIIQMFYNRQRELALRKCMGSNGKGLFLLLFAEVAWMCFISFLLSLALTEIIVPWLYTYLPQDKMIPIKMTELLTKQFVVFIELLIVCILVIFLPIRRLQGVSIIHYISRNASRHHFRNFMMGVQLVVCIFFLGIASGLGLFCTEMNNRIFNPLSENETEHIVRLNINSISLDKQKEVILTDIRKMPEIESIIYTHSSENLHSNSHSYTTYQDSNGNIASILVQGGSPAYFDFFQIPFQGKLVSAEAGGVVYVSEAFSQVLTQDSVQGMVKLGEESYHIGGVYKALYKENTQQQEFKGSVFFPNQEEYSYYFRINKNEDVTEVIEQIKKICYRYVPETISLSIFTLDKEKNASASAIEMSRNIMLVLASVSILLVVLSIYSSISMDTMSRQKEVAIRKVNGATPRIIALIFGKTYCILYVMAFIIAFPLTYLIVVNLSQDKFINTQLPIQLWGATLFISIAALVLLTTSYKIYCIMHINPSNIIKTE